MPASASSDFVEAPVLGAWDETPQLRGLRLALGLEIRQLHQVPGQFLRIRSPAGDGFYALANAPAEDGQVELLIRRGNAIADAAIAHAEKGSSLSITAPSGAGFPVAEAKGRDVLLFAAGSGISPIRALIQCFMKDREKFGRVALYHGQRKAEDFAYLAERPAWQSQGVSVVLACSQPDAGWPGFTGRVHQAAEHDHFSGLALDGAVSFLCGMKQMVVDTRQALALAGLPTERTFLNY